MRRTRTALACALFWLGIGSASLPPAQALPAVFNGAGFVKVEDGKFTLNGRTLRVAGVNNHYLTFGSDEEVRRVLDDAVAMNANVVRIIVGPVIGSADGKTKTIWNSKSEADSSNLGSHGRYMMSWDDKTNAMSINAGASGLGRLDFVLAEAGRRHLKVIVALLDFWGYMGGSQQFSAWYGSADKYTFFAQDQRTQKDYRDWVKRVVTRVNAITGVENSRDPTVFCWELMNEPDIQPQSLLLKWVEDMASYIKSLDPNHLVSTGHGNMVNKLADLAAPSVDFGTWHAYPGQAGLTVDNVPAWISQFCDVGHDIGKPVILEEFGLKGTPQQRLDAYRRWIEAVQKDGNCGGWVVWRLVARQDSGEYPIDNDGFDVKNDGGPLWTELQKLARQTVSP